MQHKWSLYTLLLCMALMFYSGFVFYPRWQQKGHDAAIAWDVAGYYWYLPSVFIYKDLRRQEFKDSIFHKYKPSGTDFQEAFLYRGNYVMKYSSGMALMYMPFFLTAHLVAGPLGYPQDGFSLPYQFAIQFGGFLIALLGLWLFRKLLLRFYNDKVVALSLFALVVGTNYLNYGAIDTGMPHSWLFTLYVALILCTVKFYEQPGYKYAIYIGLLVGLATLTRPTDIISLLIPLTWGLRRFSKTAIEEQVSFLNRNSRFIDAAGFCVIGVFSIQLIYWHHTTGQWLVYSYQDQGFSWLSPNFRNYLFSYSTGWLVYTPMMFLAFVGLVPLIRNNAQWPALLTFFLVNLYIVCAWNIWYYGGRAMVQSYPVLMFPIAALFNAMLKRRWLAFILSPVVLLFVYINIWYTYNSHAGDGVLDAKTMSEQYFWRVVGRWHPLPKRYDALKDLNEFFDGKATNLRLLYTNNYEDSTVRTHGAAITGGRSLYLGNTGDDVYAPWEKVAFSAGKGKWIRAQATFLTGQVESDAWLMRQFTLRFFKGGEIIKHSALRVDRFLKPGKPGIVSFDVRVPEKPFDSVGVSYWNPGSADTLLIDDLKVWSFDPS